MGDWETLEMPTHRIGLTMRSETSPGHGEIRDALARDWVAFMAAVLPEAAWMALPSAPGATEECVARWELDGFILTGGNDLGQDPVRDSAEKAVLALALERALPVLGVCRGLQFVQSYFGGRIARADPTVHLAARHVVRLAQENRAREIEVNSFHGFCVREGDLVPDLSPFAVSGDGCVEGARSRDGRIVCLQWHPEREEIVSETDRRLIRSLFGWE